jgi:hypothetical protein
MFSQVIRDYLKAYNDKFGVPQQLKAMKALECPGLRFNPSKVSLWLSGKHSPHKGTIELVKKRIDEVLNK